MGPSEPIGLSRRRCPATLIKIESNSPENVAASKIGTKYKTPE